MLLRAFLFGGVWNGFLLGQAKKQDVPCRFCGKRDGDGHRGSAMELLDGTLKLRYCTTIFSKSFPPGFYLGLVRVVELVKGVLLPFFFLLDCRGNFGKRVRLTRKTRAGIPVLSHPDPGHFGHPTPRRWKRLHHPDSSGAEERWASLAIFFLEAASGGTSLGGSGWQSSRRDCCTRTSPF